MKKHIVSLIATLIVVFFSYTSIAGDVGKTDFVTIINSSAVNVRSAGSADAPVIAKGAQGRYLHVQAYPNLDGMKYC